MTSTATSASSQPDYHALAAYDAAALGKSSLDELRTILLALVKLTASRDYAREVVHDLAKVGYHLAVNRAETLEAERTALKQALKALKGAVQS